MSSGKAACVAHMEASVSVLSFFTGTLPIFALEFFAIALAIFEWKDRLTNSCITLYTDNTAAFGAILNAGSPCDAVASVTMRLWSLIAQCRINLRLALVSSTLNIADLPTRRKVSTIETEETGAFLEFTSAFRYFCESTELPQRPNSDD